MLIILVTFMFLWPNVYKFFFQKIAPRAEKLMIYVTDTPNALKDRFLLKKNSFNSTKFSLRM